MLIDLGIDTDRCWDAGTQVKLHKVDAAADDVAVELQGEVLTVVRQNAC